MKVLRRLAAFLPKNTQLELKRINFRRQIRRGRFIPQEPEILEIARLVRQGDWAIDVGANVGHYTLQLAECAGPTGRVLAFEPLPEAFELLAANTRAALVGNVTLFNVAASSSVSVAGMDVPRFEDTGLDNLYQARIGQGGAHRVLCIPLDALPLAQPIRLVKIDAEGHDMEVLNGMQSLIARDRPILIVESSETGLIPDWLRERGYGITHAPQSPNIVAQPLPARR